MRLVGTTSHWCRWVFDFERDAVRMAYVAAARHDAPRQEAGSGCWRTVDSLGCERTSLGASHVCASAGGSLDDQDVIGARRQLPRI